MKCLATIDTLYWRSNEQSVEGDRPQKAPVLESRETFPGKRGGFFVVFPWEIFSLNFKISM